MIGTTDVYIEHGKYADIFKSPEPPQEIYDGEHIFSLVLYVGNRPGKIISSRLFNYSGDPCKYGGSSVIWSQCEIWDDLSYLADLDDILLDMDIMKLKTVRLILLCGNIFVHEVKIKARVDYEFECVLYEDRDRYDVNKMKKLSVDEWSLIIGHRVMHHHIVELVEGVEDDKLLLHVPGTPCGRWVQADECVPILRPLDQITDEEKFELAQSISDNGSKMIDDYEIVSIRRYRTHTSIRMRKKGDVCDRDGHYNIQVDPGEHEFNWLTCKGFDIYGWIEKGIAIKQEDGGLKCT